MFNTLQEIVNNYNDNIQAYAQCQCSCTVEELLQCFKNKEIEEIINKNLWKNCKCGKRHPHQYRYSESTINEVKEHLKKNSLMEYQGDFQNLYDWIRDNIQQKVKGFGELGTYDCALRLGASIDTYPQKHVYLHAGAKEGYKNLTGENRVGNKVKIDQFPTILQKEMKPHVIEDFLCCCKDELKQLNND